MKINRFKSFFLLPALFMGITLAGCSNSEDIVDGQTQEGMGSVSFTIKEKNYEPVEEVAGTRAAAPEKPEIQDLGDGWMAEVSLVPDTTHAVEPKAKTRVIYTPTHYTIQAYQGNVKKGELKGTFNGANFTPDAGQGKSIILPHGTYDFVCFNDKVSANGTQFTVNRADAGTARFTVKRGVVINQDPKQFVDFEMKHAGAQINHIVDFVNCPIKGVYTFVGVAGAYFYPIEYQPSNPAEDLKYTVETDLNAIPETENYDLSTDSYTYPVMGRLSKENSIREKRWGSGPSPSISVGDNVGIYSHAYIDNFLPTTDCAKLKLTFTFGELYGRNLVGKSITVPTHKLVEANKAYRVVVKLFMSNMYLFNDGTVGHLDQNPGKTPIGVVIEPYRRIAVALKDADDGGTPPIWSSSSPTSHESISPATNYNSLFQRDGEMSSTEDKDPAASPARQLAFNYYQTVGYGNSSYMPLMRRPQNTWYVPTLSEFLFMGTSLGKLDNWNNGKFSKTSLGSYEYLIPSNAPATGFAGSLTNFPQLDMTRFNKAFTDAGGVAPTGNYWLDTESQEGSFYSQVQMSIGGTGYNSINFVYKGLSGKVRPFIRY